MGVRVPLGTPNFLEANQYYFVGGFAVIVELNFGKEKSVTKMVETNQKGE